MDVQECFYQKISFFSHRMVAYPPLEPAKGSAAAALHSVPPAILLFVLLAAPAADLEDVAVLNLHLDLLLLQPRHVRREDMGLRRLLPVDARTGERRGLVVGGDAREQAAAA